jgi:hypothetical protein
MNFVTDGWFRTCLADAETAENDWYSNRHTFCSWVAMNGAPIKEIVVAAGHKAI